MHNSIALPPPRPKIAPITKGIATGALTDSPPAEPSSEDSPDHKGDCDRMARNPSLLWPYTSEDSPDHKGDCDPWYTSVPREHSTSEDSPDHKGDCDQFPGEVKQIGRLPVRR